MIDARPYRLTIIIPAFNEEKRIGKSLERIFSFVDRQKEAVEVIVVDDCSADNTVSIVREFFQDRSGCQLLMNSQNLGKGASVKAGMLAAQGQYRLFCDADLSTPIEQVLPFLDVVGTSTKSAYDVVIGSRRVPGCDIVIPQPFLRQLSGRFFSILVRLIVLKGFLDTQCGFKLFSERAAKDVFSRVTIPGFGFDVEALFIASRLGYKICEFPVRWANSTPTKVQFLKDSTQMFNDLFRIRRNDKLGHYK